MATFIFFLKNLISNLYNLKSHNEKIENISKAIKIEICIEFQLNLIGIWMCALCFSINLWMNLEMTKISEILLLTLSFLFNN